MSTFVGWHLLVLVLAVLVIAAVVTAIVFAVRASSRAREERIARRAAEIARTRR